MAGGNILQSPSLKHTEERRNTKTFWLGALPSCPETVHLGAGTFQMYVNPPRGKGADVIRERMLGSLQKLSHAQLVDALTLLAKRIVRPMSSDVSAIFDSSDRNFVPNVKDGPLDVHLYLVPASQRGVNIPPSIHELAKHHQAKSIKELADKLWDTPEGAHTMAPADESVKLRQELLRERAKREDAEARAREAEAEKEKLAAELIALEDEEEPADETDKLTEPRDVDTGEEEEEPEEDE